MFGFTKIQIQTCAILHICSNHIILLTFNVFSTLVSEVLHGSASRHLVGLRELGVSPLMKIYLSSLRVRFSLPYHLPHARSVLIILMLVMSILLMYLVQNQDVLHGSASRHLVGLRELGVNSLMKIYLSNLRVKFSLPYHLPHAHSELILLMLVMYILLMYLVQNQDTWKLLWHS